MGDAYDSGTRVNRASCWYYHRRRGYVPRQLQIMLVIGAVA